MIQATLLPAIFGLLGVVVGGLITAASSYWLDRKRDMRERTREKHKRLTELQTAARLIQYDFRRAVATADSLTHDRVWLTEDLEPPSLEHWPQFRHVLAQELPTSAWETVTLAVECVETIKAARTAAIQEHVQRVDDAGVKSIEGFRKNISEGEVSLREYTALFIDQ